MFKFFKRKKKIGVIVIDNMYDGDVQLYKTISKMLKLYMEEATEYVNLDTRDLNVVKHMHYNSNEEQAYTLKEAIATSILWLDEIVENGGEDDERDKVEDVFNLIGKIAPMLWY